MARQKPSWVKTNVSWETKKAIWLRWSLGDKLKDTKNYLELHADQFKDAPVDRNTIKKVKDELYRLPANQVRLLLQESPELDSLIFELRPDIHKQIVPDRTPATQLKWLKNHFRIEAIEEHHSDIISMLEGWVEDINDYYDNPLASYCFFQIEHDYRFDYLLQHCPSIYGRYELFNESRNEYIKAMSKLQAKMKKEIPPASNDPFIEVAANYATFDLELDDIEAYPITSSNSLEEPDGLLWGFLDNGVKIVIAKGNNKFLSKCVEFHKQLVEKYDYSDNADSEHVHNCCIALNGAEEELKKAMELSLFSKEYLKHYCDLCRQEND